MSDFKNQYEHWDEFLRVWPQDRLAQMTLDEYTQAGSKDSFINWIESRLDKLGSIWGGSSFKFGVYSRKDKDEKVSDSRLSYSDTYGWYSSLGSTADEAFSQVKGRIGQVASLAGNGDLDGIENLEGLGEAYKWKIAFHYQDRNSPQIVDIFKKAPLSVFVGADATVRSMAALQRAALAKRPTDMGILEFGHQIWTEWSKKNLPVWKLSHGNNDFSDDERQRYLQDSLAVMHSQTGLSQGKKFTEAPVGTLFYLCHGNSPQLIGQFTSVAGVCPKGEGWLQRTYRVLKTAVRSDAYQENSKKWSPRGNSTFWQVGADDLPEFDRTLLTPYFATELAELAAMVGDEIDASSVNAAENSSSPIESTSPKTINQILYGPPGTGKTFATIDEALRVLDSVFFLEHINDRKALKARFDSLAADGYLRFVTFHQSFSYEDFVEGLRATTNDENQLEYKVEPGVFKRLCDDARTQGAQTGTGVSSNPRIWKISISGTGPSTTLSYCLNHSEARIGWGATGDLRQPLQGNSYYESLGSGNLGTLRYFAEEIMPGDILICIHSAELMSAVGVVTGDYRYDVHPPQGVVDDYNHVRPVKWLYRDLKLSILPLNDGNQFIAKTVYKMDRFTWGELLEYLEKSGSMFGKPSFSVAERKPHVLIIDEINRGNISRIFGELITLIEPSKRAGADEALEVTLPYSKKPFSVPSNVYLIGTMNTADRSLTGLDIALRRRFTFKEMPPKPELLDEKNIAGVNLGALLRKMNERIEVLLDRDHCLGHAYFISLKDGDPLEDLATIFRQQILPLLQEYFFEDWERIRWVLNDHRKSSEFQFIEKKDVKTDKLFGAEINIGNQQMVFKVNNGAFSHIQSYLGILDHQKAQKSETTEVPT